MGGRASEEQDAEFVAFVDRRARRHVRAAALLTGDWHAAEDLVQTCLVKLYRAWPRLDSGVDLDAYLRRMLVNTHRSWWRARWRREAPVATIPDRAGEADSQDRHARAAAVRQALQSLPATLHIIMEFRDHGAHETVSAPPAGEVTRAPDVPWGEVKPVPPKARTERPSRP